MAKQNTTFTMGKGWIVDDAADYKAGTPVFPKYRFPCVALDPTPGGSNLGRMEWCVELLKGKKREGRRLVGGVAVWARQTRDPRYVGRVFHLPMQTDCLSAIRIGERCSFFAEVWRVFFCEVHDNVIFEAYVPSDATALVIETSSSIGNNIQFE